jgi:hypothetical protein
MLLRGLKLALACLRSMLYDKARQRVQNEE